VNTIRPQKPQVCEALHSAINIGSFKEGGPQNPPHTASPLRTQAVPLACRDSTHPARCCRTTAAHTTAPPQPTLPAPPPNPTPLLLLLLLLASVPLLPPPLPRDGRSAPPPQPQPSHHPPQPQPQPLPHFRRPLLLPVRPPPRTPPPLLVVSPAAAAASSGTAAPPEAGRRLRHHRHHQAAAAPGGPTREGAVRTPAPPGSPPGLQPPAVAWAGMPV
jgi:hypothetical protein